MSLKRKRSLPSLTLHLPSPPTTSPASNRSDSTRWSTSPQTSPSPPPAMSTRSALYPPRHIWDAPSAEDRHLDSRTRKRTRDSRPAQEEIYQTTLGKLFGAQRVPPTVHENADTGSMQQQQQQQQQQYAESKRVTARQKSLHSFWTLPASMSTAAMAIDSPIPERLDQMRCEDCDRLVVEAGKVGNLGDSMDIDEGAGMGGLSSPENEVLCSSCRRVVCGLCAVQGDRRVCLNCARSTSGGEIWGR